MRLALLDDLSFITDFKLNSRLGLMSIRDDSYHRRMVNLQVNMLRRRHNALQLQAPPKLTRCLRNTDVKARAHSRISLSSPSLSKAKRGMLFKARYGSYQSPPKAGEIEETLTTTASFDTRISDILQGSDAAPRKLEQIRTRYRAIEREDLCIRISLAKNLERTLVPLLCWVGNVNRRGNFNEEGSTSTGIQLHSGYAIGFAMTTYWCFALRLELVLFLFMRPKRQSVSLSLGYELRFPSVVTWDSEIVALALRGDVDSMKMKFTAGAASPFDVLPNGSTLLHVCTSPFSERKALTDPGTAGYHAESISDGGFSDTTRSPVEHN